MSAPRPSQYFVNAWVDYGVIGGASILLFVCLRFLGDGVFSGKASMIAAGLAWLINWPHFSATSYRLYQSKENIRQYPMTALVIPFVVLAAMVGALAQPVTLAPYLVKVFLLWSPYHFSGQTVGVSLVYARRAGFKVDKLTRWALAGFVYMAYLSPTIRAEVGPLGAEWYGIHYPSMGLPGWMVPACQVTMALSGVVLLFSAVRWSIQGRRVLPPIVLLPAASQFVWFIAGASITAFTVFVPMWHSLQYLLVAWSMQLKDKLDRNAITPSKRYVATESMVWGGVNLAGGIVLFYAAPHLVASVLGVAVPFATGCVIACVQIHHFFVDGVIWKLKSANVASPLMVNLSELTTPRVASPPILDMPAQAAG